MIPIYRGKKIDSDEYVEGFLVDKYILFNDSNLIGLDRSDLPFYEIDPSTLAMHFEDMKDSEGTKIFASLGEHGGDIVVDARDETNGGSMVFLDKHLQPMSYLSDYDYSHYKVVGIQS